MVDMVKIELVNATTDGFPFICPLCHKEKRNWDYLRVFLKNNPNPRCVHLKCLVNALGFNKKFFEEVK